jgi:integrase
LLDRHILPGLGSRKVVDITPADITKFLHSVGHQPSRKREDRGKLVPTPILANRARSLLSKMLALAIAWDVRSDPVNPIQRVAKFPERSRERFLSGDEIKRLGDALRAVEADATEAWQAIAAIRLLLFTGCRRGEILSLKWEYVDHDMQALLLPDSKTGRKTVYLTSPVFEVLDALPKKADCPYVLPARFDTEGHFQGIGHIWERIREKAGLGGVRIHDLRHTFASTGVGLGVGLPLIGGLLGHARATTTEKYAHLAADPTRKAGARIARQLRAHLGASDNVIPFVALRNENNAKPIDRSVRGVRKAQKSSLIEPTDAISRVSAVSGTVSD